MARGAPHRNDNNEAKKRRKSIAKSPPQNEKAVTRWKMPVCRVVAGRQGRDRGNESEAKEEKESHDRNIRTHGQQDDSYCFFLCVLLAPLPEGEEKGALPRRHSMEASANTFTANNAYLKQVASKIDSAFALLWGLVSSLPQFWGSHVRAWPGLLKFTGTKSPNNRRLLCDLVALFALFLLVTHSP